MAVARFGEEDVAGGAKPESAAHRPGEGVGEEGADPLLGRPGGGCALFVESEEGGLAGLQTGLDEGCGDREALVTEGNVHNDPEEITGTGAGRQRTGGALSFEGGDAGEHTVVRMAGDGIAARVTGLEGQLLPTKALCQRRLRREDLLVRRLLSAVEPHEGGETFEEPWFSDGVAKLSDRSGLPIFVSEFSVRAQLDGWSNEGGAESFVSSLDEIEDQGQRGDHYQSQIAQFAESPWIVGASWHAWSDRYDADDPDHQMNLGLMQCDDPEHGYEAGTRWDELDDRIAETNCAIEDVIAAATGL